MKSGFTLIELVVVVALLAVVAAVAIPTYQLLLSQAQLNSATTQVADLMRLQEQKTVTEQKIYGLTIVAGATTIPYFLCQDAGCSTKTIQYYTLPSNIVISQESFSSNDVRFSTAGAPSSSGTVVLKDTARSRQRNVDLRPSGAIQDSSPEY